MLYVIYFFTELLRDPRDLTVVTHSFPTRRSSVLKADIVAARGAIVPGEGVIIDEEELRAYESDGLTAYRQLPLIVVLPETTEQVSRVLRCCQARGVKVVPRGAGTSLSGGALPLADGIILGLGKLDRKSTRLNSSH